MAVIKGNAAQTTKVTRESEGAEVYMRMLRDGTLGIADLIALLSLEGRIFTCNGGTGTTAVTFGAGTLATTEFDLHVAVPSSVIIIPLELSIIFDTCGTIQIVECAMASGTGSVTGAGTALTPASSNPNVGRTSACTVTSIPTVSSATAFTANVKEIWHAGDPAGQTVTAVGTIRSQHTFRWNAKDSGIYDIVGPSQQLAVWASAQAGVGFLCFKYAELPVSAVD